MELKFLGTGSAFATDLYNTSAFFIEDNKLFLIDCGETTFAQLFKQNFLKNIREIFVAVTHTHSDHIASIGCLIKYCAPLRKKINIIVPSKDENGIYEDILDLLNIFNIYDNIIFKDTINFILDNESSNYFSSFESMKFLPTNHAPELENKCYSILFKTPLGNIFYSSDSVNTKYITKYLNKSLDKMYVDVTLTIPTVHLDLNILESIVPKKYKKKIYCMHFDSKECMNKAKYLGFNIAPSVAKDLKYLHINFTYAKYDDILIFSNCDETAFFRIMRHNLLSGGINKILINLKDTNYNSVSGLGSLLCHSYFILKKPIYFLYQNANDKDKLLKLAKIYGLPTQSMEFIEI